MRKTIFLMLTLFVLSAASVKAQVTIGSNDDPHGGAILDLSKAGNSSGFLLPRVHLNQVDVWQINGDKDTGVGMTVYNTNNGVLGGNGSGVYVWTAANGCRSNPAAIVQVLRIMKGIRIQLLILARRVVG